MKICFLVGSMAISGGTYVIVQHASYLHDHGYQVTLAVQEPFTAETLSWHDETGKLRCIPIAQAKSEKFDLVIATWWKTVFELGDFDAGRYAYFVQSIESRFYPEDEIPLRALVDKTYTFPISYVTEATWIQRYLHDRCGHPAALVRNGIRKDVYSVDGPAVLPRDITDQPRVLVEGHFGVPFKNTALAIRLARKAGAQDIWLLTGSPVNRIPGVSRLFSRVPMVRTPEIYRSCDILIKLSTVEGMFGPPLEMFHCGGTAIVFDVSGHDEYIEDGVNAVVVSTRDTDKVVHVLRSLLNDRRTLSRLQEGAIKTANHWLSWTESSSQFSEWIDQTASSPAVDRAQLLTLSTMAFEEYRRAEKLRIHSDPAIVRRHKLSALAAKLPQVLVQKAKSLEAVGEVLFGGRKAH